MATDATTVLRGTGAVWTAETATDDEVRQVLRDELWWVCWSATEVDALAAALGIARAEVVAWFQGRNRPDGATARRALAWLRREDAR